MCAEVWDDEKKAWINPHSRDNHYWDCEVMALALAYILNVRHMAQKPEARPKSASGRQVASIGDRLGRLRR